MSKFYVQGKEIIINTNKKEFAGGSEGKLYLAGDKIYKIYHKNALNEGFGNKKIYHQSLLGLSDLYNHYVLPTDLIFDEEGNYVGYVTPLINKKKQKEGVTNLDWDNFITNITEIEKETDMLSESRFLLVDLGFHNSLFNPDDKKLYLVDPGRYHHQSLFTISDYKRRNKMMLSDYFKHMLEREIFYFKLVDKNKVTQLTNEIVTELDGRRYSEFFEEKEKSYDTLHEFIKTKAKFLK